VHAVLKSDVRKAGYGVIDVECRDGDENITFGGGKKRRRWWGSARTSQTPWKKYGQDSIVHKPHNSDKASLHRTNETEKDKHIEVGSWHPNRTAEFHFLMKNRRPITAGEQFLHHRKIVLFANEKIVLGVSASIHGAGHAWSGGSPAGSTPILDCRMQLGKCYVSFATTQPWQLTKLEQLTPNLRLRGSSPCALTTHQKYH
jgi:hypothetical protein